MQPSGPRTYAKNETPLPPRLLYTPDMHPKSRFTFWGPGASTRRPAPHPDEIQGSFFSGSSLVSGRSWITRQLRRTLGHVGLLGFPSVAPPVEVLLEEV